MGLSNQDEGGAPRFDSRAPPFCHIQLAQTISGRPSFEYSSGFQLLSLGHFNGSPF
jgi:hypothetical protein